MLQADNRQNLAISNPKADLHNFNEHTKFGENPIMKTYLYDIDPLKPHFYLAKLGFTGVYIIVPCLFEEKPRDTVFGFPWCVACGSEFLVGTLSP